MRHRTVRFSSPTVCRSRLRQANPAGAATFAAGRAARTPAGAPSVPNVAADGAPVFGYEVHVR